MCGIVAYTGGKIAYPILINGIKKLEYRGYDSAGLAMINKDEIKLFKNKGKVADLEKILPPTEDFTQNCGIAHTRWATHGVPNKLNAHPHYSFSKDFVIVHNGIIENFFSLKNLLLKEKYKFRSETDTEVLISYFEFIRNKRQLSIEEAVRISLKDIHGAYAFVLLSKDNPKKIISARKGSPLVIGIGKNNKEFIIASDALPIIEYTRNVIFLNDNELAITEPNKKVIIKDLDNNYQKHEIHYINLDITSSEKGDYEHFMLKEIFEQPTTIYNTFSGRLNNSTRKIYFNSLENEIKYKLANAKRIIIVACGTSWHAGLVGEYMLESLARIPVEVEYASEFRYRNPIIYQDDVIIAISQSGETADTLSAIRYAKEKGASILSICNVFNSSMTRESDTVLYTYAGIEIGVASTKAFTSQVTLLLMLAMNLANNKKTIKSSYLEYLINELQLVPEKCKSILRLNIEIKEMSTNYIDKHSFLYLGRDILFPIALEGALKLKEISYIHAEGYPAAEMKHGPIAMIDENLPVVLLATNIHHYKKIVSNAQEVISRKGSIIAIVNKGDTVIKKLAKHVIEIPKVDEILQPLLSVIPLHLLSYHIALLKGCNVDQPRNLAKSVTVE